MSLTTNTRPEDGFTIERTFKAPPEKVWEMWTTKEGIAQWWAPSAKAMGYEMTVQEMDFRVGGNYAFVLTSAEHTVVNRGTYTVIKSPRRLVWIWHFDIFLGPDEKPYDVPMSLMLERTAAGGTKMTFKQGPLATPEHTEGSRQGVLQNFEHLAAALSPEETLEVYVDRQFDATPERVWQMWTQPDQLQKWWGPEGLTAPVVRMDAREGGTYLYSKRSPDGLEQWTTGTYREVSPPERLVMTESRSNAKGEILAPLGASANALNYLTITVTLAELPGGKTKLTLRQKGAIPIEKRKVIYDAWVEAFNKLAVALS